MTGKINFRFRPFLSIILIALVMFFIALYSINSVLSNVKNDSGSELSVSGLLSEEEWTSLYETAVFECQSKEGVELFNVGGKNLSIDCNDIRDSGRDGFEAVVSGVVADGLSDAEGINVNVQFDLGFAEALMKWSLVGIIILTGLMIFLGRVGSLINLGIVGIIGGSPFIVLSIIGSFIRTEIGNTISKWNIRGSISNITDIVGSIVSKMHSLYLMVFVLGIVLLGIGLALIFVIKTKQDEKKPEEKPDNEASVKKKENKK